MIGLSSLIKSPSGAERYFLNIILILDFKAFIPSSAGLTITLPSGLSLLWINETSNNSSQELVIIEE
jgi:hypothetical protein